MKKLILFILFAFIFIFGIALPASAQNTDKKQTNIVLPQNQTVNNDYFASGDNVTLSGTVNGDAYVAGGNVVIEGTVNGDLLVAGGNVNIRGRVTNDVRAAGGQVNVSGNIGGNLTVAGGSINITDAARLTGSLVAAGGSLEVFAPIGKEANIAGGQITLGNSVAKFVNASVGQLTVTSRARINGDLNYWSNTKANIQQGAVVEGQTRQNLVERPREPKLQDVAGAFAAASLFFKIVSFLSYLVVGLLLIRFAPVYSREIGNTVIKNPWMSLLVGFLAFILAPILFVMLLITIIGIPLALILLAVFLIKLFLSVIFASLAIGYLILKQSEKNVNLNWALVLGLIIYEIATLIPVLGGLVTLFAFLFGLGAILIAEKNIYLSLKSKNLI
ncbi:MAG: hypothetical protein M1308_19690 [Actinobacteria bacterium]|nr:hypothetical protein [Actinomycetota bacterium]